MFHRNGPVDHRILGVMQQCIYETKICDIYDLQKRRPRSCVRVGGRHSEYMLW